MLKTNTKVLSRQGQRHVARKAELEAKKAKISDKKKAENVTIMGFIRLEDLTILGYRYKINL